jgi:hypothetical protein
VILSSQGAYRPAWCAVPLSFKAISYPLRPPRGRLDRVDRVNLPGCMIMVHVTSLLKTLHPGLHLILIHVDLVVQTSNLRVECG